MNTKNIIKSIIFKFPKGIRNFIYKLYNNIKYPQMSEQKRTFGSKNPDITFYVIRPRTDCIEGLMSLFRNVLKQLSYADSHNYIPVVDFENYKTQYNDETVKNTDNAWEYYFSQPSKYKLSDVYKSKNVILSGINNSMKCSSFLNINNADSNILSNRLFKKYLCFSDNVLKKVYAQH